MKPAVKKYRPCRKGYTLIELMVALVSASVLLAGLSSTIWIALQAADLSKTSTDARSQGHEALAELTRDLEFAQAFSILTPTAIAFTVPDRNGDSSGESIRYAWTGQPGDPLTRQINGGAVTTVVNNVHLFEHDLPLPPPKYCNLRLQVGGDSRALVQTGVGLLNASL